jgi:hypothetical protein
MYYGNKAKTLTRKRKNRITLRSLYHKKVSHGETPFKEKPAPPKWRDELFAL